MQNPQDFSGAKLVCLIGARLLTLLRDDIDIPWPAYWDLPGGGREGNESPEDCVLRETHEEFGLRLTARDLIWKARVPSWVDPGRVSYFFAAKLPKTRVQAIVFGDEGQEWRLMKPGDFVAHPRAVPHFRDQVRDGVLALGGQIDR